MLKVYVAGPYSADNVMTVLRNMGEGMRVCTKILQMGYAPFCPWLDFHYVLHDENNQLNVQRFYDLSMAWLEVSDCLVLIGDWTNSKGTIKEIARANELGIPVYQSVGDFLKAVTTNND